MRAGLGLAAVLWLGAPAFAGRSLVLTPGISAGVNDPNLPKNQAWRVEFQLHDWAPPTASTNDGNVWDLNGIGASAAILMNGVLRLTDKRDAIAAGSPCDLYLPTATKNVLVRVQRDPSQMRFVCELWNSDGSGYTQRSVTISSFLDWGYSGGGFGSPYTTAKLGFFRIFTSIVPDGSRPPITADAGNWTDLKFDGSLSDSSGHGHSASLSGAVYEETPNQLPAAIIKTDGAPFWSAWVSLRAGYPATLDGTSSFSLADGDDTVTYFWQVVPVPQDRPLPVMDHTAAKPVVRGLVFGTYKVLLRVKDVAGRTASKELEIGAVAMDDNGVVIQSNPAADVIFGPMIAFGKNPWPWADDMALHSATVRQSYLKAISPPGWTINLPGTISYTPAAVSQAAQTSLTAPLSATDTSITVGDASRLDFSNLPSIVMVHAANVWSPIEEVRICSVDGNVLNVCYDGRGWRAATYERVGAPQAWAAGATVLQVKTVGTGTNFLTDFCPAGPGEPGQIAYVTGTVSVTPGSTLLTGSGTSWDGSLQSLRIRIQGTHAGQPFAFFASISAVGSATSMTLSRPWPANADSATGLQYAVIRGAHAIARGWARPDGTIGKQATSVSSCESDTQMYNGDIFTNVAGEQKNQIYSTSDGGWFSEFGPNYYDEVLAEYAGYFRSGYRMFLDNARAVGNYLAKSPDFDEGWLGTIPRRTGATGLVAGAVLDGQTNNWYTLRNLAGSAVGNPYVGAILPGCDGDLRETAYSLSWLALAALFDPKDTGSPTEPGQRSYWKAQLANAYTRDNNCRGPNSEFPTAYWQGGGSYHLTNGSTTVTGTGIAPSMCPVTASGAITVSSGSTAATGVNFRNDAKIIIIGQRQGQPYLFYSVFTLNSPTSITLASAYDGDSGTYQYQIESDIYWMSFAARTFDAADHQLMNTLYACRWVDSSTVTLDRPWSGPTGTYGVYRYQELGYGTQPFLLGIKTMAMKWASLGATGDTADKYASLAASSANWIMTTGFDPPTGGLHYARGWAGCEPNENPRLGCTYATSAPDRVKARFLNAEAQNAMRVAYEANPTAENKMFGDEFYGAQWGKLGGPWHDDVYLSELELDSMWSYKWLGFLFGIGMAHQWPAVRLGGVQPPQLKTQPVTFSLASAPGSVGIRVTVTEPSGEKLAPYLCSNSPCLVRIDKRQGSYWRRIEYLNGVGRVVKASEPELIDLTK